MNYDEYAIYLRKSRQDLEVEKYEGVDTLDRHRKTLTEYALKHNLKIGHTYEEVVSGETIEEREQMQQLLSDIENRKWAGVLVMEVERLARGDTIDQGIVAKTFKFSNTKIITPAKTYDPNNEFDEEYFEFGLYMSRREYKTINRRLQRGRLTSVSEGKYLGSVAPFGYKRKKLENEKGYTLEINDKEANIVKTIFNLYVYEKNNINQVVKTINELCFKPRKTKKWSISTVKDILSNPTYIGKIKWDSRKTIKKTVNGKVCRSRPRNNNYIIKDGLHPAIIDKEIWQLAQKKRRLSTPAVPHNNEVKNPLSGIVFCKKCGKPMQRRTYTSKSKEPTLICNNPNCDNISSKLYLVEQSITNALKIWLKGYVIDYEKMKKTSIKAKVMSKEDMLKQIESNLKNEKSKLEKIYTLLEEGIYSKDIFNERSNIVKENLKQLQEKANELKVSIEHNNRVIKEKNEMIPKIQNVLDVYEKFKSDEEKNMLLKTILEKVTYLKTEKAIKKDSDPTNFEINIYPKVTKM